MRRKEISYKREIGVDRTSHCLWNLFKRDYFMNDRVVKQGEFYRHFKNKIYQILAVAIHSETREKMVVYQALYGDFQVYVRPYAMFVSEVDHVKYPDVKQKYRFAKFDVTNGCIIDEEVVVSGDEQTSGIQIKAEKNETNSGETVSNTIIPSTDEVVKQEFLEPEEGQISPLLLEFLDCDTYEDKLDKFVMIKSKVDDRLLNDIAMSLDITVESNNLKEKYEEIKSCLLTFVHFEDNRMR